MSRGAETGASVMRPFDAPARAPIRCDLLARRVEDLFGGLDAEALNRQPAQGKWSVAQCLDHIMVLNRSYFDIPAKIRAGTYPLPFHARFGFMVNFFGTFILQSVHPDRRKPIKTFPVWEPSYSEIPGDIVARFKAHQDELKAFIRDNQDLAKSGAIVVSPASRLVVYRMDVLFEIMLAHEERHVNQAAHVRTH
jgi:hypothetical protein